MRIHPLAPISPEAALGQDVEIGPFCVVEPEAVIGAGCVLESRVTIKRGTVLGDNCRVCDGAVLGGMPQHVHVPDHPGRSSSAPTTRSARTSPSIAPCRPITTRPSATTAC